MEVLVELPSTCVVDSDRLNYAKMRGVFESKFKRKNDYKQDLSITPCELEGHIGAKQLFTHLVYPNWRTPTVKHHCPRTALACAYRMISNKVLVDQSMFGKYLRFMKEVYFKKIIDCFEHEVIHINMDEWLKGGRYTKNYQQQLLKAVDRDHFEFDPEYVYENFCKIELQYTEVEHELKETPLNKCKERMISGPSNQKKVFGNAFMNKVEYIIDKYYKNICVRKNWIQICELVDQVIEEHPDYSFDEDDGSGFDMSQVRCFNLLMNELLLMIAQHPNVIWDDPLDIAMLKDVLEQSLVLRVSIDRGDLQFTADGRASGDGWTMIMNSFLQDSYYQFTHWLAGINHYFSLVKSDDVISGRSDSDNPRYEIARKSVFTDRKDFHTHGLAQICTAHFRGPIDRIRFLSNEFFKTEFGKVRLTRIPARVIQMNSWSTKLMKYKTLEERLALIYSKGSCLLSWGKGLPIWEKLGKKMMQLGRPGKVSEFDYYSDAMRVWHDRDDREAYLLYLDQRYDISSDEVRTIESAIDSISYIDGLIYIDALEKFNRDTR